MTAFAYAQTPEPEELSAEDVRVEQMPGKRVERHPYLTLDWARHGFDIRNDFRIERAHFTGADGNEAFADIFIPEGNGPFTAVIIIPPLNLRAPSEKLAKDFARSGIMAVHMSHVPLNFDEAAEPQEPSNAFRLALENAQRFTGYVIARPDVNAGNVGVVGLSMGGIIGARNLAEDERLRFGAFGLAGANLGPAMADSKILAKFRRRMAEKFHAETREELIALLEPYTDPVDPKFNTRDLDDCVIVMAGARDKVVLPRYTMALSEAFEAEVKMHRGGHYSIRGAERMSEWMREHTKAVELGMKCSDPRPMFAEAVPK